MAGFIDGEGCVRWNKGPSLEVTNTNRAILEEFQAEIGGTITCINRKTHGEVERPCYRLTVYGQTAESILFKLLPWLCVKKTQASVVCGMAQKRRDGTLTREEMAESLQSLKDDKAISFPHEQNPS